MYSHACKVLLLRWMTTLAFEEKYEFFELFSGEGRVTQLWWESYMYTYVPIDDVQSGFM